MSRSAICLRVRYLLLAIRLRARYPLPATRLAPPRYPSTRPILPVLSSRAHCCSYQAPRAEKKSEAGEEGRGGGKAQKGEGRKDWTEGWAGAGQRGGQQEAAVSRDAGAGKEGPESARNRKGPAALASKVLPKAPFLPLFCSVKAPFLRVKAPFCEAWLEGGLMRFWAGAA